MTYIFEKILKRQLKLVYEYFVFRFLSKSDFENDNVTLVLFYSTYYIYIDILNSYCNVVSADHE